MAHQWEAVLRQMDFQILWAPVHLWTVAQEEIITFHFRELISDVLINITYYARKNLEHT